MIIAPMAQMECLKREAHPIAFGAEKSRGLRARKYTQEEAAQASGSSLPNLKKTLKIKSWQERDRRQMGTGEHEQAGLTSRECHISSELPESATL